MTSPKAKPLKKGETIELDCGRLVVRRLQNGEYVGMRVSRFEFARGNNRNKIEMWHETLEATERRARAGLLDEKHYNPPVLAVEREAWKLARYWMTRRWTCGSC